MTERNKEQKTRGVFEKIPGSGVWWVRYIDAEGKLRREKACSKSAAIKLVRNRKTEAWEGKKLPKLRTRVVRFAELADDYLEYSKANNQGAAVDKYRIATLRAAFGDQVATIAIGDIRKWFDKQKWEPGTFNRCRTVLRLIFKLGIENKKLETNPADLLKHKREPDGKVRYLSADEETRLRKAILPKFPKHLPELVIALGTGMRAGEMYDRIDWSCVDLLRRDLFIPNSKNGSARHIPLNAEVLAAFKELFGRRRGENPIFASERGGDRLLGARHWFEDCLTSAGIKNFRWHDLRHTFASRMVMAGVDIRTVAELMGHKKIQMTMRYAHLAPAHNLAAIEKLSEYNRLERAKQQDAEEEARESAIISKHAEEKKPTDTPVDTGENSDLRNTSENVQ